MKTGNTFISFVKKGGGKKCTTEKSNLLTAAKDWQMHADLGKQLVFPSEVTKTCLRPDISFAVVSKPLPSFLYK